MRINKKVLAAMMAVSLMFVSVMGVSASESNKASVSIAGSSKDKYEIAEGDKAFASLETGSSQVHDKITGYNEGTVKKEELLAGSDDALKAVEGKEPVGLLHDLVIKEGAQVGGTHEVTLSVPALTDKMDELVVVYYDASASTWKVVKPSVDFLNKTITVKMDAVGAFGIWASITPDGGSTGETSPTTGSASSTWMLWVAVVLVVAGAGVVATQRKRNQ